MQYFAAMTLLVLDYDQARDWYRDKLGFVVLEDQQFDQGGRWLKLAPTAQAETGLVLLQGDANSVGKQGGGHAIGFVNTHDFWGKYRQMRRQGVHFVETPREEPYATVVVFEDLYGNRWDLLQPNG